MDCSCLAVMTSNQYPIESSWLKYYILEPIDQQPAKNKAPVIINIELIKIYKIIVSFFSAWQNMSKVYVETLSKHKQFSQDVSDKGISVMYLEVFFIRRKSPVWITMFPNFSGKFQIILLASIAAPIYITTLTYFKFTNIASFWIYVRCSHIVLKLVTLAAVGSKNLPLVFGPFRTLSTVCQPTCKIMITFVLLWN